eukprot:3683698-Pleurochrysis_carterae.AAC.1
MSSEPCTATTQENSYRRNSAIFSRRTGSTTQRVRHTCINSIEKRNVLFARSWNSRGRRSHLAGLPSVSGITL